MFSDKKSELVRVTSNNGRLEDLLKQWEVQYREHSLENNFEDYAKPTMDHMRKIANESPQHKNYGIYSLKIENDYVCTMHVNDAALPGTNGRTLRILWILLAPKYDYTNITVDEHTFISTSLVLKSVKLAEEEINCTHLKIHISNVGDRRYFASLANVFNNMGIYESADVRGNWFFLTM